MRLFANPYKKKDVSISFDNNKDIREIDKVERLKVIKKKTWTWAICSPW